MIHGDCLEEMKKIPDNSVDCVLTDPPYGTTQCKWDTVIPFEPMWKELKRITKDNGAICLFGTEPFSSHLRISNLKMFKYDYKWIKNRNLGANFAHAKNSPIKIVEEICVFSKGKINHKGKSACRMSYEPQGLRECKQREGRIMPSKIDAFRSKIERPSHKPYIRTKTGYPDNTLRQDFCGRLEKKKDRLHPTQKPVALLEYLIKTYTLENETVLDFTMGSGSTGVACKNLNRNFIGIEKDPNYFEIAKNRISEHQTNLSLGLEGETA